MARYKDLDLNFNLNPLSRDINVLTDRDAVRRSVRNVVLYNFLEKPFQPRFGGNVIRRLFENLDPVSIYSIKKQITDAIQDYETRATVISVTVQPNFDTNSLEIDITFSIRNSPEPIVLNITLERVR
tara:strand:- start:1901 stop:2281 length:381 start_codon:yes stop_codon:yes gene_type:complete